MSKFKNISLFLIALTFVFTLFGSFTTTKAQNPFVAKELIEKMEQNQKTLTSLRSNVKMSTTNPQTGETDTQQGTVLFIANKNVKKPNVRIDWTSPREEFLSVIDGKYKLYRPALNQVYVGSANSTPKSGGGALDFINMSGAELKQNFKSVYQDQEKTEDGFWAYKLKLTPKNDKYKYQYAEIWVDEKGMPLQAKVVNKGGDTTMISLSKIERNPNIKKDQLKLNIPSGTKEVKA